MHGLRQTILIAFVLIFASPLFAYTNLLTNGGAEFGNYTGWTIVLNGGNGWGIGGGRTGSYGFATSYNWDTMYQKIDLIQLGYDQTYLNAAPTIAIEDYMGSHWIDSRKCPYYVKVNLLDASNNTIATYSAGSQASPLYLQTADVWQNVSYQFTGYPSGLRYVYFEHGGRDGYGWAGQYGTIFDDMAVYFNDTTPAPTTPTINSTSITNSTGGTRVTDADTLVGWVNASDASASGLTIYYTWFLGGAPNQTGTYANVTNDTLTNFANMTAGLSAWQNWTLQAIASNGGANSSASNSSQVTIQPSNYAPAVLLSNISNATGGTQFTINSILVGWANLSDDQSPTLTVFYKWYKDGSINSTGYASGVGNGTLANVANITYGAQKSQAWILELLGYDGTANGTAVNSSQITIGNTAPSAGAPTIEQASAYKNTSKVTCLNGSASDADSDGVTFFYEWFLNGAPSGVYSQNMTNASFSKGDALVCQATPYDGTANGTAANSTQLAVGDTAPALVQANLTDENGGTFAYNTSTLVGNALATDLDGDALNFTCNWYRNGAPYSTAQAATNSAQGAYANACNLSGVLADGDVWKLGISTTDGTYSSAESNSSTVSIRPVPTYVNLLINGDAEYGNFTGWTKLLNGGNGWAVGGSIYGRYGFVTSYNWDSMYQRIDLVQRGYSRSYLNTSPTIAIEDYMGSHWISSSKKCPYYVLVNLLDESNRTLATYSAGSQSSPLYLQTADVWQNVSYQFTGYAKGLRYIYFEQGGKDGYWWAGQYGTIFDNASAYLLTAMPSVGLLTPANASVARSNPVNFSCNAFGNALKNLTFFAWHSNGTLYNYSTQDTAPTNSTLNSSQTLQDGKYYWNCVAMDADNNTIETANGTATVRAVPLLASAGISASTAQANSMLTCQVAANGSQDNYTLTVSWQKNAVTQRQFTTALSVQNASTNSTSITLNSSITQIGDAWRCAVLATDGVINSSANYSEAATVQNTPLSIISQAVFSNASAGHSFTASATVYDAAGGSDIALTNISTTAGTCAYLSNESRGTNFTATFRCNATAPATATVKIGFASASSYGGYAQTDAAMNRYPDHAPSLAAPAISPTTAYKNYSISCRPGTFSDSDADLENGSVRSIVWYRNGAPIAGETGLSISAGNFSKSDAITCSVTSAASTWTTSNATANASVTVQNSEPKVQEDEAVEVDSSNRTRFNLTATGYDADGAGDISSVAANVVQLSGAGECSAISNGTTDTTVTPLFECHTDGMSNWIIVSVTFRDQSGASATTKSLIYVPPNDAPSVTAPAITPADANKSTASVSCNGGTYSDPNGDSQGTSSWKWLVNGQEMLGQVASTLSNSWYSGGDNVSCGQVPRDSYGLAGTAEYSANITIRRAAPTIAAPLFVAYPATGHSAYFYASAEDNDGADAITSATATSSLGNACAIASRMVVPPNGLNVTFQCEGTALTTDEINATFTGADGTIAWATAQATYRNIAPEAPKYLQPSGGQSFVGEDAESVAISWSQASDADGDTMGYSLFYSNDSGLTWNAITASATNPYSWNASSLPNGYSYRIRLNATDGYSPVSTLTSDDITIQYRNIFGNSTKVNNESSRRIEIDGSQYANEPAFKGIRLVTIDSSSDPYNPQPVLQFAYNFARNALNLSEVTITNGSASGAAYAEVRGINHTAVVGGKTITLYDANPELEQVCVKDEEDAVASAISSQCNGANEYAVICNGTQQGDYTCTMDGTTLTVTGLSHSALIQYAPPAATPAPLPPSAGTYSNTWLSRAFNCSTGELTITATYLGEPARGLGITLYGPQGGAKNASTGNDGRAGFTITKSGNYSAESEKTSAYPAATLENFELALCKGEAQGGATGTQSPAPTQSGAANVTATAKPPATAQQGTVPEGATATAAPTGAKSADANWPYPILLALILMLAAVAILKKRRENA